MIMTIMTHDRQFMIAFDLWHKCQRSLKLKVNERLSFYKHINTSNTIQTHCNVYIVHIEHWEKVQNVNFLKKNIILRILSTAA